MWFRIRAKSLFCFLSLTFLYTTVALGSSTECPPKVNIEPCSCYYDCSQCSPNILCENITDQEVLSRVLFESSEYQYYGFTLKQTSVMYIPDYLFDARNLGFLNVKESSMVSLFNKTPTSEPLIYAMSFDKVLIHRGLEWNLLSGLHTLSSVYLTNTHVHRIDQSFVDYAPKSLEYVTFNACSTTRIHDRAFASLPNLQLVAVNYGKIKELKRSMFPTPSKLYSFSFRGNRLSSLPEDIFSEMPDLKYIYLQGNLLKEMPENIFKPKFPNLEIFNFDDNPLKCRCSIRWITVVKNQLTPKYFLGICQEPKNMHGRWIRDLVPADFSHCA